MSTFEEKFGKSVGAVWINRNPGKPTTISVTIDGEKYVAFKNKFKTDDNKQPDYRLHKAPQDNPRPQARPAQSQQQPVGNDEEIPF